MKHVFSRLAANAAENAWMRRLLTDVLPGSASRAGRDEKSRMLARLRNALYSIPSFDDYRSLVHAYSGKWPGPRPGRPDDVPGLPPADDAAGWSRSVAFLKNLARREYVRTGAVDFLESYMSCAAALWIMNFHVYVPEDLDRLDPAGFLAAHNVPRHIEEQLVKFWTAQGRLPAGDADVSRQDLLNAASSAAARLGPDRVPTMAIESLANAINALATVRDIDAPTIQAERARLRSMIDAAGLLIGGDGRQTDRITFAYLNSIGMPGKEDIK